MSNISWFGHKWVSIGSNRPDICLDNNSDGWLLDYDDKRFARTNYQCSDCKRKFSHYYHIHSPEQSMEQQDIMRSCPGYREE